MKYSTAKTVTFCETSDCGVEVESKLEEDEEDKEEETDDVYSIPTALGTITSITAFQREVEEDEGMKETRQGVGMMERMEKAVGGSLKEETGECRTKRE